MPKKSKIKQTLVEFFGTLLGEMLFGLIIAGLALLLLTFGKQIAVAITAFGMLWLVLPLVVCAGLLLRWLMKNTQ